MFRRLLALVIFVSCGCAQLHAEWLHKAENDPFSKATEHMVMASEGEEVLIFKCSKASDLLMAYAMVEHVPEAARSKISLLPAKLLMVVDNGDVRELEGRLDVVPSTNTLRIVVSGSDVARHVKAAAEARRSVALALKLFDDVIHKSNMSASGSRSALSKLSVGCNLSSAG